jgi:hypothetical protein
MAMWEELNKNMAPAYRVSGQIKDIKRLLDMFDCKVTRNSLGISFWQLCGGLRQNCDISYLGRNNLTFSDLVIRPVAGLNCTVSV